MARRRRRMSLGERTLEKRSGGEWCLVLDE